MTNRFIRLIGALAALFIAIGAQAASIESVYRVTEQGAVDRLVEYDEVSGVSSDSQVANNGLPFEFFFDRGWFTWGGSIYRTAVQASTGFLIEYASPADILTDTQASSSIVGVGILDVGGLTTVGMFSLNNNIYTVHGGASITYIREYDDLTDFKSGVQTGFSSGSPLGVAMSFGGAIDQGYFADKETGQIFRVAAPPANSLIEYASITDMINDSQANATALGFTASQERYFATTAVPIPTAVWLFGSALGLIGLMRRKRSV